MRLLTLLLLISAVAHGQKKNIAVFQYPLQVSAPVVVNGDTTVYVSESKAHTDSLKATYTTAQSAQTTANSAAPQTSLNATNSTVANHGLQITTHTSQISSLQNQINNIVIPIGVGIPKPIYISGNYTLHDSCFNRTIWAKGRDTIYCPVLTPGFTCRVQAGSGTVILKTKGTGFIPSSQYSISTNSREAFIDYKKSDTLNIRQ